MFVVLAVSSTPASPILMATLHDWNTTELRSVRAPTDAHRASAARDVRLTTRGSSLRSLGVIAERRTVMRKQSVVSLLLTAALLTGCVTHRPPAPTNGRVPAADDEAGSVAANILYVPGRGLVCGASGLLAGVAMIITLGQAYDSASELMHGGCSGPWVLGPRDVRQAVP
jgi:hypothetical protein